MKQFYFSFQFLIFILVVGPLMGMECEQEYVPQFSTPLQKAAAEGDLASVVRLLAEGADVNAPNRNGDTPLHLAVQENNVDVVKRLLQSDGLNVNAKDDEYGRTALHWAISMGYEDVIRILLRNVNILINIQDNEGRTPLHYAVDDDKDDPYMLKALLNDSSFNINVKDKRGQTVLHRAIIRKNVNMLSQLLSIGAIKVKTPDYKQLLDIANNNECNEIVKILENYKEEPLHVMLLREAICKADVENVINLLSSCKKIINIQNVSGITFLHDAVYTGQAEIVKLLLTVGEIDVNSKDCFGRAPLHCAAKCGYTDIVREFLKVYKIIDVNAQDNLGQTPLHLAVICGHENVLKVLIDEFPEIQTDLRDEEGNSPIRIAVDRNELTMVGSLLKKIKMLGTIKEIVSDNLLVAAANGYDQMIEILLQVPEVNVNVVDEQGLTSLAYAVINNHETTVNLLLDVKGINVNIRDNNGRTPLHHAVYWNNQNVVKTLLFEAKNDIDVNVEDNEGLTPLATAVLNGYLPLVKLLLGFEKIEPNEKAKNDSKGFTPLHWAVYQNNELMVNELINTAGIDVNVSDNKGKTILHWALQDEVCLFVITAREINVNVQDLNGDTPVHYAIRFNQEYLLEKLLRVNNINTKIKNNRGITPLQLAHRLALKEMKELGCFDFLNRLGQEEQINLNRFVKLLLKHETDAKENLVTFNKLLVDFPSQESSDKFTALHAAAASGEAIMVQRLLDMAQVDINAQDDHGGTPLHLAFQNDHEAVIKVLLEDSRIKVNIQDYHDWTPLHVAALRLGNEHLVQALLASGADVNIQNNAGKTPLHMAISADREAVVKILLRSPTINVNVSDKNGETPLKIAEQNESYYVAANKDPLSIIEMLILKLIEQQGKDRKSFISILPGDLKVELAKFSAWGRMSVSLN